MAESDEARKKRWAAAAAKSYMTPSMTHALNMSKQQSVNKYKEQFDKSKGKGFTAVVSTPQIEHAKKQSTLVSQNKYKSDFEKNKAKFTSVADDPETIRISKVGDQISNVAYHGRGSAVSKSRRRKQIEATTPPKDNTKNNALPSKDLTKEPETTRRHEEASTELADDEYEDNDELSGNDTAESKLDSGVSKLQNHHTLPECGHEQQLADDAATLRTTSGNKSNKASKSADENQPKEHEPADDNQPEHEPIEDNQPEHEPADDNQPEDHEPAEYNQPEDHEPAEYNQPEDHEPAEYNQPEDRDLAEYNQPEDHEPAEYNQPEEHEPAEYNQPEDHEPAEYNQPEANVSEGCDIEAATAQADDLLPSENNFTADSSLDDFYANLG